MTARREIAMNDQMLKFLRVLSGQAQPIHVRNIGIGCSAQQGQARQDARHLGYAEFYANEWSWAITSAGRDALKAVSSSC